MPLYRDVRGLQGVQGLGVFAGLQWGVGLGSEVEAAPRSAPAAMQPGDLPSGPAVAALLVAGRVTLVDYWAPWCAPCLQLAPQVEAFARQHPEVAVARLDVGDWDAATMRRYLPGLPGIPVIDLWGPDGRLLRRLVGAECGDFAAVAAALPGVATAAAAVW